MSAAVTEAAARVVFVHGIWLTGTEMWLLRRRVARAGFICHQFSYPSVRIPPEPSIARLRDLLHALPADRPLHLVGHSLGGLIVLRALQTNPPPQLGKVVLLGTPVQGSWVARQLAARRSLRWTLGQACTILQTGVPEWRGSTTLGVIAGRQGIGIGRLFPGMPQPSDGVVAVAETWAPGAERLELPVTHSALWWSQTSAAAIQIFLREGHFGPSAKTGPAETA